MRKLVILKSLIDFFFITLCLGGVALVALFVVFLLTGQSLDVPVSVLGNTLGNSTGASIVIGFYVLAYVLFIYTIYLFKKMVSLFMKTRIFDNYVIKALNQVGLSYILICLMLYIPGFVYNVTAINNDSFEMSYDFIGNLFDSFLFLLIIGLFFMVLSSIFKIAKHAKEENDLTV